MAFADPTRIRNGILDILNAAATFGGAIITGTRSEGAIEAARIASGLDVLRAISRNPGHGWYGALSAMVAVEHNAFLPAHDGEPGIPWILPFAGGVEREGFPASPDRIDAYRLDSVTSPSYTLVDGKAVPHDQKDADGRMSPVACRYSLVNKRLKFTGLSAKLPLVQLTREMADAGVGDAGVSEAYESTVIKLSIPRLVKRGDDVYTIAQGYGALGMADLAEILAGAMAVRPLPSVEALQRTLL